MKIRTGAALAAVAALGCLAGAAQSQTADRTYENGPVWTIGYVETKPGMFDDYMAYINGPYRALQEAAKRRGEILEYHTLAVDSPRDHEPDVILLVEYRNMGVFDRSLADQEKDTQAVFGSSLKSSQSAVKREDIRILHGGVTARELLPLR